ncbi:hypothetical protein ACFRAR_15915 [Kitasatospora sp. NPDC056651]|uniref:hypothetical protein n=1 Tax=Kitasatospora sp. NPDC056651 TaxID=3345892 RepID=UPI0036B2FADA
MAPTAINLEITFDRKKTTYPFEDNPHSEAVPGGKGRHHIVPFEALKAAWNTMVAAQFKKGAVQVSDGVKRFLRSVQDSLPSLEPLKTEAAKKLWGEAWKKLVGLLSGLQKGEFEHDPSATVVLPEVQLLQLLYLWAPANIHLGPTSSDRFFDPGARYEAQIGAVVGSELQLRYRELHDSMTAAGQGTGAAPAVSDAFAKYAEAFTIPYRETNWYCWPFIRKNWVEVGSGYVYWAMNNSKNLNEYMAVNKATTSRWSLRSYSHPTDEPKKKSKPKPDKTVRDFVKPAPTVPVGSDVPDSLTIGTSTLKLETSFDEGGTTHKSGSVVGVTMEQLVTWVSDHWDRNAADLVPSALRTLELQKLSLDVFTNPEGAAWTFTLAVTVEVAGRDATLLVDLVRDGKAVSLSASLGLSCEESVVWFGCEVTKDASMLCLSGSWRTYGRSLTLAQVAHLAGLDLSSTH